MTRQAHLWALPRCVTWNSAYSVHLSITLVAARERCDERVCLGRAAVLHLRIRDRLVVLLCMYAHVHVAESDPLVACQGQVIRLNNFQVHSFRPALSSGRRKTAESTGHWANWQWQHRVYPEISAPITWIPPIQLHQPQSIKAVGLQNCGSHSSSISKEKTEKEKRPIEKRSHGKI